MIWRNLGGLPLSPGHATVWVFPAKPADLTPRIPTMMAQLSTGERAHSGQISDERVRLEYIATRFFIRTLLSRAMPERGPQDWVFTRGEFGKPALEDLIGISFNITHTTDLIAAAFTVGHDIGVDIERVDRARQDVLKMAPDYFSAMELRELAHSKDPVRRFYDLWAVKEAYIKARGMGLDFRLQGVSFAVPVEEIVAAVSDPLPVQFAPIIEDREDAWRFFLSRESRFGGSLRRALDSEFSLGLAIRTADPIEIGCVEFLPDEPT